MLNIEYLALRYLLRASWTYHDVTSSVLSARSTTLPLVCSIHVARR